MSQMIRRIAVITGSRAEYGLLRTVLDAIDAHPALDSRLIVAGSHLLPGGGSIEEIRAERTIHAEVPMQEPGQEGREADAIALGRGVQGFAAAFGALSPQIVLVLGDRIEAFAAAAAASVAGLRVAHLHGGDRAPDRPPPPSGLRRRRQVGGWTSDSPMNRGQKPKRCPGRTDQTALAPSI